MTGDTRSQVDTTVERPEHGKGFRHEALLYAGPADFLRCVLPFVLNGVSQGEPVLVAVPLWNADPLQAALGDQAGAVEFVDMLELGRNPGRIIGAWRDFLDRSAVSGRTVRGVGEPIWAGRSPDELDECSRHEALLNTAFGDDDFWLVCPYDVLSLPKEVISAARRNHPIVRAGGTAVGSDTYRANQMADAFKGRLSGPPAGSPSLDFGIEDLAMIRLVVAASARNAGVPDDRLSGLVMAVNEVATNSILHGGGHGTMVVWTADGTVYCEIRDAGVLTDPLLGRGRAASQDESGRGLWLAHQLCDLVQVRSAESGTVVRMHLKTV